jgi:hypothetical protein
MALFAVFSLDDLEIQSFKNAPRNFPNDARVVNDQTCFHVSLVFLCSRMGRCCGTCALLPKFVQAASMAD